MLLLFQKIEGVDVCLFAMYVHEFGAKCPLPNQRRIYLAYLDSVNYFRPEVKTTNGEALRTFVYHELLIGYLDFCKRRGFTSCYIWVCPPTKGDDYIFNGHPQTQKTPQSNKLQEWYLKMLDKADKEDIIKEKLYLYDHFFVNTNESKAKVTATCLPYFDGDYISIKAEDVIVELEREETEKGQKNTQRTRIGAVKRDNMSKDSELMQRLGQLVYPFRKGFILVHLQHICRHCCEYIVSGSFWTCKDCKYFIICNRCYDMEVRLDIRQRHHATNTEKHQLCPITVNTLGDTADADKLMGNEVFDTRELFLNFCQSNHYQFDTLRRAKHSSMMLLYHLHNPTTPTFAATSDLCEENIQAGQNNIYPSLVADGSQSPERNERQKALKTTLAIDLLRHVFQCASKGCQDTMCRRVKKLFRHEQHCKAKTKGGCKKCKKIWSFLQVHARACKQRECHVYHCSEYKEKLRQRDELRRHADVDERMRSQEGEDEAIAP